MKKLMIILTALLATASCTQFDISEVLLPREDISLTVKGEEQFSYDKLTCQISHKKSSDSPSVEYRVFDERLSKWFIFRCDMMPTDVDQEVNAELSWTSGRVSREMKDLTFSVKKTDDSGKIWLWCEQKSIGIVIKNL